MAGMWWDSKCGFAFDRVWSTELCTNLSFSVVKSHETQFRHPLTQAFQSKTIAAEYQSHTFALMRIWPGFIFDLENFN